MFCERFNRKHQHKLYMILGLFWSGICVLAVGDSSHSLSAEDVLDRYFAAREKLTSFIMVTETETKFNLPFIQWSGTQYIRTEERFDGTRGRSSDEIWGNLNSKYNNIPEDQPAYTSLLWDGEIQYAYGRSSRSVDSRPGTLVISRQSDPKGITKDQKMTVQRSMIPGMMLGYLDSDNCDRLDKVFEYCENIHLRQEIVKGQNCYVIEAAVKERGQYTLWIDPAHNYNIIKYHILRTEGDHVNANILPKNTSREVTVIVTDFHKIGNYWFPRRVLHNVRVTGEFAGVEKSKCEVTSLVLNPDHEAMRSFTPYDIVDGDVVMFTSLPPSKKFRWENGKVGSELSPE